MDQKTVIGKTELVFALLVFVLGMVMVYLATSRYGPGVSTDAVNYLAAADHLAVGEGLLNFSQKPLVAWPPLYPFLLGVMEKIFGIPALISGRILNIIFFGLIVILSGVFFRRSLSGDRFWFYIGSVITLVSLPILSLSANIFADPLFILLSLVFLLIAQEYMITRKIGLLIIMIIVTICETLLRYIGVSFIVTGFLIIWATLWQEKKRALIYSVVFGLISSLPIAIWVVGRNYLLYDTFTGRRPYYAPAMMIANFREILIKIGRWFVPTLMVGEQLFIPFLVVIVFLVILAIFRPRRLAGLRQFLNPPLLPVVIFTLVYFGAVLRTTMTQTHPEYYYDDRYLIPIYIPLFLLLVVVLDKLILFNLHGKSRYVTTIVLVLAILAWTIYPAYISYKFIRQSMDRGVIFYDKYNNQNYRESAFVDFLEDFQFDSEIPIYSNIPAAVYLFLKKDSQPSPVDPMNYYASRATLESLEIDWPKEKEAYFIWFESNDRRFYFSPRDLRTIAEVKKMDIFDGEGGLYFVRHK